jgi:hypothetical protein
MPVRVKKTRQYNKIAFSSEVDAGSREENASKQQSIPFSSEVDAGSRQENASKEKSAGPALIPSMPGRL